MCIRAGAGRVPRPHPRRSEHGSRAHGCHGRETGAPLLDGEGSLWPGGSAALPGPLHTGASRGQARRALVAADVALVASGTATLETALCKRPMVVAYRLGALSAFLLRQLGLVKVRHISQPNLLAGSELVPEFVQEQASPGNLADALADWLEHPEKVEVVRREFAKIHETLRRGGAERATGEIAELLAAWTAHASTGAT